MMVMVIELCEWVSERVCAHAITRYALCIVLWKNILFGPKSKMLYSTLVPLIFCLFPFVLLRVIGTSGLSSIGFPEASQPRQPASQPSALCAGFLGISEARLPCVRLRSCVQRVYALRPISLLCALFFYYCQTWRKVLKSYPSDIRHQAVFGSKLFTFSSLRVSSFAHKHTVCHIVFFPSHFIIYVSVFRTRRLWVCVRACARITFRFSSVST